MSITGFIRIHIFSAKESGFLQTTLSIGVQLLMIHTILGGMAKGMNMTLIKRPIHIRKTQE